MSKKLGVDFELASLKNYSQFFYKRALNKQKVEANIN